MFNKLFKKRHAETDEEMKARILSLCKDGDYGLCPPAMDAQVALNELKRYLLGDDWYVVLPVNAEQCNTEIVYEIERRYKKYRQVKEIE